MIKDKKQSDKIDVLVVDDDMAIRLLMRESLELAGLTVEEAENGLEALEVFGIFSPKIVLLDVNMPKMDGFTACSRLRKLPGGDETTIVIVTGLEDVKSIERAYDAGATDFITKPVSWPILNHRIRYLIRARDALNALRRSESRLYHAQRIARLGHWSWDINKNYLYMSDMIYQFLRTDRKTFGETYDSFLKLVHPEDKEEVVNALTTALEDKEPYKADNRIIRPDGTEITIHIDAEIMFDKVGEPEKMHGIVQDITERINAEKKINFLAYYDPLTNLPNRQLFKEHADRAICMAKRNRIKNSLIYLDVDRFKHVNDTLGHNVGDELLKLIAVQLLESIRESDLIGVDNKEEERTSLSRLGGDEFIILSTGLMDAANASKIAKRAMDKLSKPFNIQGNELFITVSIGIAICPTDGEDVETLLKNASSAMYHAKTVGRNNFQFYSKEMNSHAMERLTLETELKKALDKDEFVLYYQPQVEIKTKKITGLEALIRWKHPEMGMVSPGKFIPIAEETGLIVPIGKWVLQTACEQMQKWRTKGVLGMQIGVNLSPHQFRQHDIIKTVKHAIDVSGLPPEQLDLEITESAIMHDIKETIATLYKLKDIGLTLSVDDFGTGYSSMNYLKKFPIDTLKIDQSFIREVTVDISDAAITKAIIALGKALDLTIIAEGVELQEQLIFLEARGCDRMQGYLFSRPLPADEVENLILR